MELTLEEIAFHRNGVSGAPFYVVNFLSGKKKMVGVVFAEKGHIAVFNRSMLGKGVIAFGKNSYYGDLFEPQLRKWVDKYENPPTA